MPAISFTNVSISFALKEGGVYEAVDTSNFAIQKGEFVSLVGPTGCGKSTLLNAAAGLLETATGQIDIFGEKLTGLNTKAGYLFQAESLMPWKTAIDNVAISLEIIGVSRQAALTQAQEWLTRVGLKAFGNRYPHQLSGGQRKRVALAQVLIRDPEILLMDEPFGPLDAQTRLIMGDLLLKLWQEDKKAVLFVTHDLEEAIALSDRVLLMSVGPKAKIIGDYKIPLPRPRNLTDVKIDPQFHSLQREIWLQLKEEVIKTYGE
jgi:NitT/TauT family transport system ATP-binding protein